MAKNFLNQALRNYSFLKTVQSEFPDDYFDWKITLCFYTTLHCMKAFLKEKYDIEVKGHHDLEAHIDTNKGQTKVKRHVWLSYKALRVVSETCRYTGFSNEDVWNDLWKNDFEEMIKRMKDIMIYLKSKEVKIEINLDEMEKNFN